MIGPWQAVVLGVVEGLTEYLPISSTGHLILVSSWLGLSEEGVKTFEVVIQAGAVAAVLGLYRARVRSMILGLWGRDGEGRALLGNLALSFLPAAAVGLLLHDVIKARLFGVGPVLLALALGGAVMIVAERGLTREAHTSTRTLASLRSRDALLIGLAQCLALWPGMSRAMVTILAAMLLGLPPVVAAEYSFLLALPTLGAAAALDFAQHGSLLFEAVSPGTALCGFATAALVAALAVQSFVRYLTRRGLEPFGWYRLGLAGVVWWSRAG